MTTKEWIKFIVFELDFVLLVLSLAFIIYCLLRIFGFIPLLYF
jgi:hypothetical protein